MGDLQTAPDGIKSPPKSWDEQVQEWHEVLQQLAEEYIAGEAQVTFHDAAARRYNEELLPLNRALEADALSSFISTARSEERRVGKECRGRWARGRYKKRRE